jgi:hypothetical protein
MPSLRSERERREVQAVRRIFILSRLASFPACLALGPACVLTRPCALVEQITLPRRPLPKPGAGGRDGLRRKAHPEPLPSLDDRSDPQAFHHNPAQRPGLALHYLWRDYAPLQSRPPCLCSLIAAGSRSHSVPPHRAYRSERRTAVSAVAAGGSCIVRARSPERNGCTGSGGRRRYCTRQSTVVMSIPRG